MTRREQALVDQHAAWRAEADARPEEPFEARAPAPLPPREERLAEARDRRRARLMAPVNTLSEPHFITEHGITLVYGPAALMEQAWQSGEVVRVIGSTGALYKVHLANITKPDARGMVIGHPAGSLAERNRTVQVAAKAAASRQQVRGVKKARGQRRAQRAR